jgi:hypothetical protein
MVTLRGYLLRRELSLQAHMSAGCSLFISLSEVQGTKFSSNVMIRAEILQHIFLQI